MRSEFSVHETDPASTPDAEAIRAHLKRITASPEFAAAPRLARFLTFVVETALAGDGDQIKESLIAVEVYGRRPDYNPQIDSTVRVEAGRLRARLRRYYESSGENEPVQIDLPKGAYVPVFRSRAQASMNVDAEPAAVRRMPMLAGLSLLVSACMALFLYAQASHGRPAAINSVAVLPFVHLSVNPASERFCDGLTEDLTTALARIPNLRVPARIRMSRYKDTTVDLNLIGKEHGVRAVLEGSVRQDGDRIVITTQLVDTQNGYHVWADRFEHDVRDAVGAQAEVASRIVKSLGAVLNGERSRMIYADAGTMDLYHRAQELLRIPVMKEGQPERLPETVTEAVRLFEEVTARSPGFAKGWSGLAEASEWEYELRGNAPASRLAAAKAAARRAVELEPDLTEGWTVLTSILFFREWDIAGAEAACRRAIESDPRNVTARQRYIDLLRVQGRIEEARFESDRAIRLQPTSAAFRVRKALMLYQAGAHAEGLSEARSAADLTNQAPVYPMALWVQGLCLQQQGSDADAEKIFRRALAYQPHDPWNEPSLGHLLAMSGRKAEALAILTELREQLARGRMTHTSMALVHTALGQVGEAVAALELGWSARDDSVLFIAHDPRFRPLQSEPRFRKLVDCIRSTVSRDPIEIS